jgi:Asp-tRNA(Asn)/Glu-tRNA(Gln) amidotransferase A subunit family amidase
LNGARIGVVRALFGPDTNAGSAIVNDIIDEAIATMEGLGATFVDVTIPNLSQILAYPSLSAFEFKFDLNDYLTTYGAPYSSLTEIIASGEFLPSNLNTLNIRNSVADLATNAEYQDIITNRPGLTQSSLLTALTGLDALLYPTSTGIPRLNSQGQQIGSNNRLSAFSGFPALTLPAGFTTATSTVPSLPVGMEFLGRAFSEPLLLQLAYAYEQAALVRTSPTFTPPLPGETIPEPNSWASLAAMGVGVIALRLTQKNKIKPLS